MKVYIITTFPHMFMSFVIKEKEKNTIDFPTTMKDNMDWLFSFPLIILLNTLIILELFHYAITCLL